MYSGIKFYMHMHQLTNLFVGWHAKTQQPFPYDFLKAVLILIKSI